MNRSWTRSASQAFDPEKYIQPITHIAHQNRAVGVALRESTTQQWNDGTPEGHKRAAEIALACHGIKIAGIIPGVFKGDDPRWLEYVAAEAKAMDVWDVVFISLSRYVRGEDFSLRKHCYAQPTEQDFRNAQKRLGKVTPYTILPASTPWRQEQRYLSECGQLWRCIKNDPSNRIRKMERKATLLPLAVKLLYQGDQSFGMTGKLLNVPKSTVERWDNSIELI